MTKSEAMYWWRRKKTVGLTPIEKSAVEAIRREDAKESRYRKSEQGRFESEFASFDAICDESYDPSKLALLSDRGRWARIIRGYGNDPIGEVRRRINAARMKITRSDPSLLSVFYLVLKNGTDRELSIWELIDSKKQNSKPQKSGSLHTSKKS